MLAARTAGSSPDTMPTTARIPNETSMIVGEARSRMSPRGLRSCRCRVERHWRDDVRDKDRNDHSYNAGEEGQCEALEQELLQDVSAPRTKRLEQANLSCPLGNRDEHDVHDADAANAKRHGTDDSQQKVERSAELHDLGRVGNRVPRGNRFVILGVEVVAIGKHGAHCLESLQMKLGRARLEDNAVRIALVPQQPQHVKGTKAFSLSGPLFEESWILVFSMPIT